MNDYRVRQIDNGFTVDYWNGNSHVIYCATVQDVVTAITNAMNTPIVQPNLGGALTGGVVSTGQMVTGNSIPTAQTVENTNITSN